jgi:hypothetical protein
MVSFHRVLPSVTFIVALCIQFQISLTSDAGAKIRRIPLYNWMSLRTETTASSAEDHRDPNAAFLFHTSHHSFHAHFIMLSVLIDVLCKG